MTVSILVRLSQIVLVNVSLRKHCALDRSFEGARSIIPKNFHYCFRVSSLSKFLLWNIYFVVLSHWNLPRPVLSAIVLQQFLPAVVFTFVAAKVCFSIGNRWYSLSDESPDIITISFGCLIMKLYAMQTYFLTVSRMWETRMEFQPLWLWL